MVRVYGYAFVVLLVAGGTAAAESQQDEPTYSEEIVVRSWEDLEYPLIAKSTGVQGVVVVTVTLNASGGVETASALSGPKVLIRYAIDNAKKWRFQPNTKNRAVIVYDFQLDGVCQNNTSSLFRLQRRNLASITACLAPI